VFELTTEVDRLTQQDLQRLGEFRSMTLVERWEAGGLRHYRYKIVCDNAVLLQRFILSERDKIVGLKSEDLVWKPALPKSHSCPGGKE